MDFTIESLVAGVENLVANEKISQSAAQDAIGFITQDGREILCPGRVLVGSEGTQGMMRGLWFGYTVSGSLVMFNKTETAIQYWNGSAWIDVVTGLTPGTEASFQNYSSVAGTFTYINCSDGYYKIHTASPGNAVNMYDSQKNFHGRIVIDKSRSLLYARQDPTSSDLTGLYGSYIDAQGLNYKTLANEIVGTGDGSTKIYTGILNAKNLDPKSFVFGVQIAAPTLIGSNIQNITRASNAVITSATHGLNTGDTIIISGIAKTNSGTGTLNATIITPALTGSGTAFDTQLAVGTVITAISVGVLGAVQEIISATSLLLSQAAYFPGSGVSYTYGSMSEICNIPLKVTKIDANNFSVNIDSTNFTVYAPGSGGSVQKTETFIDQFDGTLITNAGATGTINYATGVFTLTTLNNVLNSANVLASYQYENSNNSGITDFTHDSPARAAGQGFVIPQDEGGDPTQKVEIGQDGAYYSIKKHSTYRFAIDDTDLLPDNQVWNKELGSPNFGASVSTSDGIVTINTSNPEKPELTIIQKNQLGTLVPTVLCPSFKFANYSYEDAFLHKYERYVLIHCRKTTSAVNDTLLLCNIKARTVDILPYGGRMMISDNSGNLYTGSDVTQTVQQILNGFDDLGDPVNAYWISKAERYSFPGTRSVALKFVKEALKKYRYQKFMGLIGISQIVQVYLILDDANPQLIGTIRGDASYVSASTPQMIGSNFIGNSQIGGDNLTPIYPYFMQIKLRKIPKFRKRAIKLVPIAIGYFDFSFISDVDIIISEMRIPSQYRQKQFVSLDGTQDDISHKDINNP